MAQGVGFGLGMQDVVARAGAGPRPLDGFVQPAAAYSFRKLRTAYTGPSIRIIRDSDQAQLDIGFTASGDFDRPAAVTHCTAANCYLVTAYDQSGNGRHATQATPANRPYLQFNCPLNGGVCASSTWASIGLASASVTWAAGLTSLSTVGRRSTGGGLCTFIAKDLNRISSHNTLANNWWVVAFTGGEIIQPATDNAWHIASAIINGVSSVSRIDGVEVTGNVSMDTAAGPVGFVVGDASTTCDAVEGIAWDNYSLTPAERVALENNQRNYWTPYTLDNFVRPAAAYGFRKLLSAYAGPAMRLRRAADSADLIVGFTAAGDFDATAANAHCSTQCWIETWNDQSGNGQNLERFSATGPTYVASCINGMPCARYVGAENSQMATIATPVWATKTSLSAVAIKRVGDGLLIRKGVNTWRTNSAANSWYLSDGGVAWGVAATDNIWHAGIGIIDGAGSVARIDNTELAVTPIPGVTTAERIGVGGGAGADHDISEAIAWDGYALTAAERAALQANQKSFWGTP